MKGITPIILACIAILILAGGVALYYGLITGFFGPAGPAEQSADTDTENISEPGTGETGGLHIGEPQITEQEPPAQPEEPTETEEDKPEEEEETQPPITGLVVGVGGGGSYGGGGNGGGPPANQPPVLDLIGDKQANETMELAFQLSFSDPDNNNIACSAANLPPGAGFDNTACAFNWTPGYDDAGIYAYVLFNITDNGIPPLSDYESISITVADVNQRPVLTAIGSKSVNEAATLTFTISANDADGDSLTYSTSTLPQGASFNATTRTFTWTPSYTQSGSYQVTFTVADVRSDSLSASETITITVTIELNQPNSYYVLNQSIINNNLTGPCINITAQNVTLDCAGHSISSTSNVAGIYSNQVNTTIKNCNVDMGVFGSGIELLSADNSYIFNNTLNHQYRGIFLTDVHNALIEDNIASFNGFDGISLTTGWGSSSQNTLIGNTANGNYDGIRIVHSTSNTLNNNTANNNSYAGIWIGSSSNNNLIRNTADNNSACGIILESSSNNNLIRNTADNNSQYGIYVLSSSLNNNLTENKFCFNSDKDVYCTGNQTFTDNWCDLSGSVCGGTCSLCSTYQDVCVDGTGNGNCSIVNPPLYCDFRDLVFNPNKCGADAGKCCQSTKIPAGYAVYLSVNVPTNESCSNAYQYFDETTIGGWINTSFYEYPGPAIAIVVGGYPTNIQCREEIPFIVEPNHGVRYKSNGCISVPYSNDIHTGDLQQQVAVLDWSYSADSFCKFNGTAVEPVKYHA